MPKSSLSISESDLREVSVAVFGAFHHYLGVGVGDLKRCPPPTQAGRVIRDVPSFMDLRPSLAIRTSSTVSSCSRWREQSTPNVNTPIPARVMGPYHFRRRRALGASWARESR